MQHTPNQAAKACNVSVNTIRNWCKDYAGHLSAGAQPGGAGARLLTSRDLEVLRYIAQLRAENMTHEQVNQRLAETKIGETETLVQPTPDLRETLQDPPMPVQSPSDALQAYQAALTIMARVEERHASLQSQIDNLDKRQAARINYVLLGILIGLLIAVVAILAIYAGAGLFR